MSKTIGIVLHKSRKDLVKIMDAVESRTKELGFVFPQTLKPVASYIPAKKTGKLVFMAGQLPTVNGELISNCLLGQDVEIDEANKAASICTLNALAEIKGVIGDLDRIRQIFRVVV
jgi:hypothetical protein